MKGSHAVVFAATGEYDQTSNAIFKIRLCKISKEVDGWVVMDEPAILVFAYGDNDIERLGISVESWEE